MGMGLLDAPPRSNGHNQQQFNLLLEEGILINPWRATATGRRRIPKHILTFCRCWFQFQKTTVFKIQIHLPYTFEFFFVETVWSNHYMLPLDPQACGSQWWHFWSDRNSVHLKKNRVPFTPEGNSLSLAVIHLCSPWIPRKKPLRTLPTQPLMGADPPEASVTLHCYHAAGQRNTTGPFQVTGAFGAAKNSGGFWMVLPDVKGEIVYFDVFECWYYVAPQPKPLYYNALCLG